MSKTTIIDLDELEKKIAAHRDRPYPTHDKLKKPDKNVYNGIPCLVYEYKQTADGAENITALIKYNGQRRWVKHEELEFQCCSECGY